MNYLEKSIKSNNLSQSVLQRRLKLNKRLVNFNYRGERTFVVVSGINLDLVDMQKIISLIYYEERMLFFLFLLKYSKTRIIYVTTKGFNKKLFDYYIDLIAKNELDAKKKKDRLVYIDVDDYRKISVAQKILENKSKIEEIKKYIINKKTTILRCYNPTNLERELAEKLQIPLFASAEKFDYVGTKSGGRKIFKLAKINLIPGWADLKNFTQLSLAMARLMKDYPYYKKLMIKLDKSASGKGNAVFCVKEFLKENDIEISVKSDISKITRKIREKFCDYVFFQLADQECDSYLKDFNKNGGIVELYVPGEIKFSPSVQMLISADKKPVVVSTHEQILGGEYKQEYLGCEFPSKNTHRRLIIIQAKKVAKWMANKGMMGNFSLDFVVVYKSDYNSEPKVYPIEINLRKGGATHPFRIAYYLTSAKYSQKQGMLYCGKIPIYYLARDIIEDDKYKGIDSLELINLVRHSKISFNKNTKKGVLIYMSGMIKKHGKFGAICIGHSEKEAQVYYRRLIKLINRYVISC